VNPWFILFVFFIFSNGLAGESGIQLKAGAGKDLVAANCMMCHSLDYIEMNALILDKQGWEKTVDKMIKVMGAPIKPDDAAAITAYLARNYGK
jgi:mono/diheme cytochrome c family protein